MSLRRLIPSLVVATVCLTSPGVSTAAEEQRLDLSTYLGTGDDTYEPLLADESRAGLVYIGVQGSTTFERQHPRRTVTARLGGSIRYFPESRQFLTLDRSASVGIDARISARNRLRATQTVQYSPYRQFGAALFSSGTPGELPIYNPDGAATFGQSFVDFGTIVEVSRSFTQRTSLSIAYASRVSVSKAASETPISQSAGIAVRRVLGRYATLKLGTAYRFGRTGFELTALPTTAQDFDIGIDYSRPLSFSRGTTLSFSSGTAVVSRAATASDPGEIGRQLVAIGAVTATQTIGRYWVAQLGFDRNIQYVDGFPDPFYASRLMTQLRGDMGRRFSVLAQADYSTGAGVGSATLAQNFRGLQSQARLNYVLSRRWRLFAAHYFTENQLSAEAISSLPPGVMLRPSQASIQVGLSFRID
jgi:hypothetical protein